jgi:hypothetical protein
MNIEEREPYSDPMTPEEIERYQWGEDYLEMYRQLREQISSRRKRRLLYETNNNDDPWVD